MFHRHRLPPAVCVLLCVCQRACESACANSNNSFKTGLHPGKVFFWVFLHVTFDFQIFDLSAIAASSTCERGCDCLRGAGSFLWIHPETWPPRRRTTLENTSQISPAVCLISSVCARGFDVICLCFLIHYQWSIPIYPSQWFLDCRCVLVHFGKASTFREDLSRFANWLLLFHKWGGFNVLNNPWMHLWGFYVTPSLYYFCLCSLCGQPVSPVSAQVYATPKRQNAAFAPLPVNSLSRNQTVHPFWKQLHVTDSSRCLFNTMKRHDSPGGNVCRHLLALYSIFTSSVTITAWAWGYCHAVAMTSGIHKKILARLVRKGGGGGPVYRNAYTRTYA